MNAHFAPWRAACSGALVLALSSTSCGGCGANPSAPEDYSDPLYSLGVPVGLAIAPDGDAIATNRGVFAPFGFMSKRSADLTEVRWELAFDDFPSRPVVDGDTIYVAFPAQVVAFDMDGQRLPFASEVSGTSLALGGHGGLLVWDGAGGLTSLDANGRIVDQVLPRQRVSGLGVDSRGRTYVAAEDLSDPQSSNGPLVLHALDRSLQTLWSRPIADVRQPPELALSEDRVYLSHPQFGTAAYAMADGDLLWNDTSHFGPIAVGADDRLVVGGADVDPATGAITRESFGQGTTHVSLDADGGIWAGTFVPDILGEEALSLARFTEEDGVQASTAVTGQAFNTAPLIGDGVVAIPSERITVSSYFPADGGTRVETGTESFAATIAANVEVDPGPWPRSDTGDMRNTRRLPQRAVLPTASELYGKWVWRDGASVRAVEFARASSRFGMQLDSDRIYGVYDYALPGDPRLVQVGTWTLEEDTLVLEVALDAAPENEGATLRRQVLASASGALELEDPLQPRLSRTYRRAGVLPYSTVDAARAARVGWSYTSERWDMQDGLGIIARPDGGARVLATYSDFLLQDWTIDDPSIGFVLADFSPAGALEGFTEPTGITGYANPVFTFEDEGRAVAVGLFTTPSGFATVLREGASGRLAPTTESQTESFATISAVLERADAPGFVIFANTSAGEELRFTDSSGGTQRTALIERVGDVGGLTVLDAALMPDGRLVLVGRLTGSVRVGEDVVEGPDAPRADALLMILSPDGSALEQARLFEGALTVARITVDLGGAITIAGSADAINLGDGDIVSDARIGGVPVQTTIFAQYDDELSVRWVTNTGSPDSVGALEADADGNLLVLGRLRSAEFRARPLSQADRTTAIAQLDRCGRPLWATDAIGGWGASAMDQRADGSVAVVGSFFGNVLLQDRTFLFEGMLPDVGTANPGTPNPFVLDVRGAPTTGGPLISCSEGAPGTSTVTVSLRGAGSGRVVSTPEGIDCPGACSATFDDRTSVRLLSDPDASSTPNGFSLATGGSLSGCTGLGSTCAFTVARDVSIEAWFQPPGTQTSFVLPDEFMTTDWLASDTRRVFALGRVRSPFTFAGAMIANSGQSALLAFDAMGAPSWALELSGFTGSLLPSPDTGTLVVTGRSGIAAAATMVSGSPSDGHALLRVTEDGTVVDALYTRIDPLMTGRRIDPRAGGGYHGLFHDPRVSFELGGRTIEAGSFAVARIGASGDVEWVRELVRDAQGLQSVEHIVSAPNDGVRALGTFFLELTVDGMAYPMGSGSRDTFVATLGAPEGTVTSVIQTGADVNRWLTGPGDLIGWVTEAESVLVDGALMETARIPVTGGGIGGRSGVLFAALADGRVLLPARVDPRDEGFAWRPGSPVQPLGAIYDPTSDTLMPLAIEQIAMPEARAGADGALYGFIGNTITRYAP